MPASYDFNLSLFEVGDVSMCCFSYCCFPCAIAQSRSNLDGSNFLMNCFLLKCVPARWLVRSAYHIPGDAMNDCLVSCFCPCCSANQLYQTTQLRGNPTPDGGAHHNMGEWNTQLGAGNARSCLYSTCCMPCSIGSMMEATMGMPWWMGCCCVDLYMARNLLRYQNRIKGNDLVEECVVPFGLQCLGNMVQNVIPCAMCIVYGYFAMQNMQLIEESQKRAAEPSVRSHNQPNALDECIMGKDFNLAQGEFYLASPPVERPSAPVAGQVLHMVGGAQPWGGQITPTVVRPPLGTQSPIHATAVYAALPPHIAAQQQQQNSY